MTFVLNIFTAMDCETENSIDPHDKSIFKSLKRQAVSKVLDFSSQYGLEESRSYTVENIVGETNNYPNYGDFTQALVFVSIALNLIRCCMKLCARCKCVCVICEIGNITDISDMSYRHTVIV